MLSKKRSSSKLDGKEVSPDESDRYSRQAKPDLSDTESNIFHGVQLGVVEDRGSFPSSSDKDEYSNSSFNEGSIRDETLDTNTFDAIKVIGHGSFGCVFLAKVLETGETVAIKKVLQNRKFKNRELHIMKTITSKQAHPFVIALKHYFLSSGKDASGEGQKEIYLNLVLDYMPETLYSLTKQYSRQRSRMPLEHLRVYMYQLARALMHIHSLGVCHRDIKPQNLLIDPVTFTLKLCDFGSSKVLVKDEPNVAYICSRYYRAPELIFGSNDYTTIVDLWSYGCVMAEVLMGAPIFPGNTGIDQLVEIIKVLGAPTKMDLQRMNPSYQEFKFPNIRAHDFESLFPSGTDKAAISVVASMLRYMPESRSTAAELVLMPFFLPTFASGDYTMPHGEKPPSTFFEFSTDEVAACEAMNLQLPEMVLKASSSSQGQGAVSVSSVGGGGGRTIAGLEQADVDSQGKDGEIKT